MVAFQSRADWRWAAAVNLLERNATNVDRVLRELDSLMQEVVRFKRDYDRGLGFRHAAYDAAAGLYFNRSELRTGIEGGLLCGKPPAELESVMGVPAEVIQAYHDLFFDVLPRLDNDGWISAVVFSGFAHAGADQHNYRDLALRTAWIGGWKLFYHLIRKGFSSEQEQELANMLIMSVAARRSSGMIFTGGNYPGSMEFIRTYNDMRKAEAKEGGVSDEAMEQGRELLAAFADKVLGTGRKRNIVADIADERNLALPAREPRVSAYEVATT